MIPCLMPTSPPPTPLSRAGSLTRFDKPAEDVERCFIFGWLPTGAGVLVTKTPLETREKERGDTERGGQRGREEDSHQQG